MPFKLQGNSPSDYRSPGWEAKRFRQKEKILLQATESLALSCVRAPAAKRPQCGESSELPRFRLLWASTRRSATEPRDTRPRLIGNHLKNSRCKFRIINHSFTPAWKCWPRTKAEKE